MRRLWRANALSNSIFVLALGAVSASFRFARIDLIRSAYASGEGVSAASGFASAVVASQQVRADGVVAARGREAVVHVVGTFLVGVADESGRAQAVRPMVPRVTLRISSADARDGAWVDAHPLLALLVEGALAVAGALGLDAAAQTVLLESLGAKTDRSVEGHLTEGVGLVLARVGVACAWVLALSVDARLLVGTLGVIGTAADADALQAVETVLAVPSALALLHAEAVRADFAAAAVIGSSACADAVSSDASFSVFAFAVRVAAEIVLEAVGQRISRSSSRTAAKHLVVDGSAFGAGSAEILLGRTGI